jgi:hypothetical protein
MRWAKQALATEPLPWPRLANKIRSRQSTQVACGRLIDLVQCCYHAFAVLLAATTVSHELDTSKNPFAKGGLI